jgi:serine/threonine protein kinase/Tfp pilus assembly protein PilF
VSAEASVSNFDYERIADLITEAMRLPPDNRTNFIATSCPDEPSRAEALGLLAALERAGGFMGRPTAGDTGRPAPHGEAPGTAVGRYVLLEEIGEGGFGRVFLAEQREPVVRRVALKIIKLGMDTRQVIARFEAERQALALMDHPNIARVLDGGATETGRPYFVMELVRGEPITAYCDTHRLAIPDRLELFLQVCAAVQHAHQKGVIHRDLKPSNILVSEQDGRRLARVIDFGIAKATSSPDREQTEFTERGVLLGTPGYMSPEQAAGSADIDTRTDVYSLGVLLYELLTGATPFDEKRLRSAAYGEIQRIIRDEEPPKPSTRLSESGAALANVAVARLVEPRRLTTIIRGDLDWIVMRALEKDRGRRYGGAGDLAQDVARYLDNQPVLATPPTVTYRVRKFARRNRVLVAASAAVLLSILIGTGASVAFAVGQARARKTADDARIAAIQAEATAARRAEELAKAVEFQSEQIRSVDPQHMGVTLRAGLLESVRAEATRAGLQPSDVDSRVSGLDQTLARTDLTGLSLELMEKNWFQPAIRAINEKFIDQPLVRARLLQNMANLMQNLGLLKGAEPPLRTALDIRERELGDAHADTLESLMQMGHLHLQRQEPEAAELFLRRARTVSEAQFGVENATTLRAEALLGYLRDTQGRHAEARGIFEKLLPVQRRVLGDLHIETIATLSTIGLSHSDDGDASTAEPLLRDALAKRRQTLGASHPDTIQSLNNLGTLLVRMDRFGEAEVLFSEALAKRRQLLGDDHPATMTSANNLGVLLRMQHQFGEAERIFRDTLQRRRRVLGEWHAETLDSLSGVGILMMDRGMRAEAEPYLRESLEKYRSTLGNDDRRTVVGIVNLAELLRSRGAGDEAAFLFAEALKTRQRTRGDAHAQTLHTRVRLGRLLVELCNYEEALRVLEEGKDAARATFAEDPEVETSLGHYLIDTAWAQIGVSKFEAAEANLNEASGIGNVQSPSYGYRAELCRAYATLNQSWHLAHPELGRDARAREWRSKLEELIAPAGPLP